MKTSQRGIDLIKQFEGCRLEAYKCPAGVWTIGYGHTAGVQTGQMISAAQAEAYLRADLDKYEKKVDKYSKYGWSQNEFDALVSFAYNVGSIDQLTANGTRSKKEIAEKMLLYNKAAGKVLPGLTRRREAERELFMQEGVAFQNGNSSASVQPTVPRTPSMDNLKVGDIVNFVGSKHYASANAASGSSAKPGQAKITAISAGAKHTYHIIHTDSKSNVYGWIDAADIGVSDSASSSSVNHVVVKGDTLSALAGKYGTTTAKIVAANKSKYPKITASYIVIGWTLTIPQ